MVSSEIPTLPASLKIKRHCSVTAAAFDNSVLFKWKILSDDRRLHLHDSKRNSRADVNGLTHTKQIAKFIVQSINTSWMVFCNTFDLHQAIVGL